MSVISRVTIAASRLQLTVKKALMDMFAVQTLAALGTTLATSAPILSNRVAVTAADGTKGVVLPKAEPDSSVEIVNTVSNQTLKVWPNAAADQINAISAGSNFSLVGGARGHFYCDKAGHWYVAAANLTGTSTSSTTAELDVLAGVVAGTTSASKALVVDANKALDTLALPASGLKIGAGAGTAVTTTAAELNVNAGVTAGTVTASKTVVADANKSVDVLQATTALSVGGTGVPGAATVQTTQTKAVTAFADTTAKTVFTATIPNANHAAMIEVYCLGVLGAGGAVGAGEAIMTTKYLVALQRTSGAVAVAGTSTLVSSAKAKTAGADDITSVVVTTGAVSGAAGASNTIAIQVAITRSGAGATNHTGTFSAKILNGNATGITLA